MKKIFLPFILIACCFIFVSCTQKNIANYTLGGLGTVGQTNTYKNGIYTGQGIPWEYGNEEALVVIEDGMIKSVVLRKLDINGNETDYNKWVGEGGRPNLRQFRFDLANSIVDKQTFDVPNIASAAISCQNWKLAVKNALEQAK